ncbi:MAG: diversity-generating retroelement protein Avd [Anaerolineae bacterium]|nr:diversity-generating retroelement protein Avd [Anaerolineae bacterium]
MQQSPIFTRTYDLLVWLIPQTTKFPREQRFVLGKAVQETGLRFQEALIEAALSGERNRQRALARADVDLAKLRFYLRLCHDLKLITLRQHRHVSEMVAEVGRLLGGWRKKEAV